MKKESEGIKAVKELVAKNVQGKNIIDNLHRSHQSKENRYYDDDSNNNIQQEYAPNRKF